MSENKFLRDIKDANTVITPIDTAIRFPEILDILLFKYRDDISVFSDLIAESKSSAELLDKIRSKGLNKDQRMSLLKMFRRCVSPVLDTETIRRKVAITWFKSRARTKRN